MWFYDLRMWICLLVYVEFAIDSCYFQFVDGWESNGDYQLAEEILPSKMKSSRSLFFASTTLPANAGLTKLEVG
jgi:hypothetical protein